MKIKHIEAPCCTLYGSGSSGKGHEGKRYLLLWLSTGIPLPVGGCLGGVWVCHVSRTMCGDPWFSMPWHMDAKQMLKYD